jgi:uncharacterized protein YndB with AHSA1/START domain
MSSSTDRIERQILLKVSRSRVWRAVSNPEEFGGWFGMALNGDHFTPGARVSGRITHPGYEHIVVEIVVDRVEPERLISWRWHPNAIDPKVDYSKEPMTLVIFELQDAVGGTLLSVVESGFDNIPKERRLAAFRGNSGGWDHQMVNIEKHVTSP